VNITDARNDYRTLLSLLNAERAMRQRVLAEPRKSVAIKEIDDAKGALQRLGQIIQAASEAGLLDQIYEQAPLLDLPPAQTTY
jgi:hypothetical protein